MWTTSAMSLPFAVSPASLANSPAAIQDVYRQHFNHKVAAGALKPLVLPYAVLASFILPILYFSIPHVNRPWLFRARYLLMVFIVCFNLSETVGSSSPNFAVGYAVGLMQAWGILWSATLLLWMRPQFEAERVERRKRPGRESPVASSVASEGPPGETRAENGHKAENGHGLNGKAHVAGNGNDVSPFDAPDEDVARSLKEGYEYYWQAYPVDAPFSTRLEWSVDLVSSFRGTGWNWGVPIIPHFSKPEKPLSGSTVDLRSIPLRTRQGFRRYKTGREWLRVKAVPMMLEYLVLDFLSALVLKDPYFLFGPEFSRAATTMAPPPPPPPSSSSSSSSPSFLAAAATTLAPPALFVYRGLACFAAILIGIDLVMNAWQMTAHFLLGPRVLGSTRGELWHYPCVYGSFTANVLDKGMAGFWGGWWHQTFRVVFSAPGDWLSRRRHSSSSAAASSAKDKALAGLLAFAQSGFLHCLGSVSCLPPSKPYMPLMFFVLCWVGIMVQTALSGMLSLLPLRGAGAAVGVREDRMPVWLRRVGNFAFTFVWLLYFQYFLDDDLGRAGVWMLEPVPVSLVRVAGLGGRPGDRWLRWDSQMFPYWWVGKTWWESGIAL